MKNIRMILTASFAALLLLGGCRNLFTDKPQPFIVPTGEGLLLVSLTGDNVNPSLPGAARTMLPQAPEFTRYELVFTDGAGNRVTTSLAPYVLYNSAAQLTIPAGSYYMAAWGYVGEVVIAKSAVKQVNILASGVTEVAFSLNPYMDPNDTGVLSYSLGWDSLSRMPARAELLIEKYANENGVLITPSPEPLPFSMIPDSLSAGSKPGTILLLDRDAAMIKLTGSLELPPGEYRLTMTLAMNPGGATVSRMDIAHVYSRLTTPAAFFYGSNDILISNVGVDLGPGFITKFTFPETPNATTVIGAVPGTDGTRLIMVMVPNTANLKALTPIVETTPGAQITSPLPGLDPVTGKPAAAYTRGEIDFSGPTLWTVTGKDGITQQYTVKVIDGSAEKQITYFVFEEYPNHPGIIDTKEIGSTIKVELPYTVSPPTTLTPVISIIGHRVARWTTIDETNPAMTYPGPATYRVYDLNGIPREYAVTVTQAGNSDAQITAFTLEGYPNVSGVITHPAGPGAIGTITATLPYGTPLTDLKPIIQYKGKSIDPPSGNSRNFSTPVVYTVTADSGATARYAVTLTTRPPSEDAGIFDFVITNVPNSKVVIGQNPRADGKIPIVIQVPYGTNELNLIPAITLRSPSSVIAPGSAVKSGVKIPFTNQQAILTVISQGNAVTQDYVVVVSQDVQFYYVNGVTGNDNWPDIYNGGSESYPFKTLAYAVYKASGGSVSRIFVSGTLNNSTEGGAWETSGPNSNTGFRPSGSTSGSVFTLIGTNSKQITVTGVSGATLAGISGRRVLSVTGGANLVFENITVTGGDTTGNGGGVYVAGNSKVKFTESNIRGNRAASGGGVFIEDTLNADSEFTLAGGSISGNTATGNATAPASLAGGGGVYVKGNGLFWLASGTVNNNTASGGSGGGVLVNANADHGADRHEDGFLMSGGSLQGNESQGSASPHGGGGVYVAQGAFEMLGGSITGNVARRQGGGVFVAPVTFVNPNYATISGIKRGSRFTASGTSSVTGNSGVGSSTGICSRGVTQLMGSARVDKVYVWEDSFRIADGARAAGVVLAHTALFTNKIDITGLDSLADQVCRVDLEMNLVNGSFAAVDVNLWLSKQLISGSGSVSATRFPLGSLVGKGTTKYLTDYHVNATGYMVHN
jgi:hypothetical protein